MEVVILPGPRQIAELAADVLEAALRRRPDPVLGLATGSSPLGVYAELRRRHAQGRLDLIRARFFLLDEYVGLPADHPQRYLQVISRELADLGLTAGAVRGPDGAATDVEAACTAYEAAIGACGGIDVQLLGIGRDGHLAFNEPGSSLGSRTRVKTLTRQTRADNARFFDDVQDVPHHVLTQGLATIGEARHLLLVATGESKAAAVAGMVEGPVTATCPASVLQLHRHATVLLDEDAATGLRLADYYRQAYAGKPPWQGL